MHSIWLATAVAGIAVSRRSSIVQNEMAFVAIRKGPFKSTVGPYSFGTRTVLARRVSPWSRSWLAATISDVFHNASKDAWMRLPVDSLRKSIRKDVMKGSDVDNDPGA
jgi:hypothetical protein